MITVKHHSGKSVFAWRVYKEFVQNGTKHRRFQIAKYRTREAAEKAAEFHRAHEARIAAVWAKLKA
jgi:hypothetical protein